MAELGFTHAVRFVLQASFYAIMRQKPQVVLSAAHLLVKRLSPFVRQIDFGLDWVLIESGRALFKKGTQSHDLWSVCNVIVQSPY